LIPEKPKVFRLLIYLKKKFLKINEKILEKNEELQDKPGDSFKAKQSH